MYDQCSAAKMFRQVYIQKAFLPDSTYSFYDLGTHGTVYSLFNNDDVSILIAPDVLCTFVHQKIKKFLEAARRVIGREIIL